MNTIKKIIAVVIIIFCYLFSDAQQIQPTASQWLGVQQKIIKNTTYIFEGTVLNQECYYGKPGILTCTVISITKIFKGSPQIRLGTIKVITKQGGQVGDGPMVVIQDGAEGIGKRGRYIIFGNPAIFGRTSDSITVHSIVSDNIITLDCVDHILFLGKDAARWNPGTSYKTLDELYSFFKENGLEVQEEVQPAVPRDSVKH